MDSLINRLTSHERMQAEKIKVKKGVEKVLPVKSSNKVEELEAFKSAENNSQNKKRQQAYSSVDRVSRSPAVLTADKIMTSPVVTLPLNATLNDALNCFKDNHFQHIPVLDNNGQLAGIVSERDVFRVLSGMTATYQQKELLSLNDHIKDLMITDVMTANVNTDIRHIAQIFIEKGIGCMPIMDGAQLKGMITNSNLLNAVMSHYSLELWA